MTVGSKMVVPPARAYVNTGTARIGAVAKKGMVGLVVAVQITTEEYSGRIKKRYFEIINKN
jgi:hypothetical protein